MNLLRFVVLFRIQSFLDSVYCILVNNPCSLAVGRWHHRSNQSCHLFNGFQVLCLALIFRLSLQSLRQHSELFIYSFEFDYVSCWTQRKVRTHQRGFNSERGEAQPEGSRPMENSQREMLLLSATVRAANWKWPETSSASEWLNPAFVQRDSTLHQ